MSCTWSIQRPLDFLTVRDMIRFNVRLGMMNRKQTLRLIFLLNFLAAITIQNSLRTTFGFQVNRTPVFLCPRYQKGSWLRETKIINM
jgi:hypothetical protein